MNALALRLIRMWFDMKVGSFVLGCEGEVRISKESGNSRFLVRTVCLIADKMDEAKRRIGHFGRFVGVGVQFS